MVQLPAISSNVYVSIFSAGLPRKSWLANPLPSDLQTAYDVRNPAETPRSEIVRELADAKEEAQKLRSELKMRPCSWRSLRLTSITRYVNFQEVEMGEGTRRHDQELINILKRRKALEGYSILKELAIDPGETEAVRLVNDQLESL
jgi:hypothetical protein